MRRLTYWCFALMCVVLADSNATAAPIKYSFSFKGTRFQANSAINPLEGADLHVTVIFDADSLVPLTNESTGYLHRLTIWPATNATASLRIVGSDLLDGVYAAMVDQSSAFGFRFSHNDGPLAGDAIMLPPIFVPLQNETLRIFPLLPSFNRFFPEVPILRPVPFAASEPFAWWQPVVTFYGSNNQPTGRVFEAKGMTGYAVEIPEPRASLLCGLGTISMAIVRRRK